MDWQDLVAHITPEDLRTSREDSFELTWAKFQIKNHESLVARAASAPRPDLAVDAVNRRYELACAMILTNILRE